MKFEVGERVQVIKGNELKTGVITDLYKVDALVKFDSGDQKDACIPFAYMMKLDQPEPVVVPEFIADLIGDYESEVLDGYSNQDNVLECILLDWEGGDLDPDYSKWVDDNLITLIDAIRNGYGVEEEPKYYVKLPAPFLYLRQSMLHPYTHDVKDASKYTEQEIKKLDERYWVFAVSVEEVEVSE